MKFWWCSWYISFCAKEAQSYLRFSFFSSHSYQVLSRQTTKESLKFYPRQSLLNQDALQGNFYFKSAKLTQCWFNFAVSWRRKHVAAMNFFKILIITTLPRSSWRWRIVPSWNQTFYWPPVNSSTICRWGRQPITGVADVSKSISFFLHYPCAKHFDRSPSADLDSSEICHRLTQAEYRQEVAKYCWYRWKDARG